MKGLRSDGLEDKLLKAVQGGDDATAAILERRILQNQKKKGK